MNPAPATATAPLFAAFHTALLPHSTSKVGTLRDLLSNRGATATRVVVCVKGERLTSIAVELGDGGHWLVVERRRAVVYAPQPGVCFDHVSDGASVVVDTDLLSFTRSHLIYHRSEGLISVACSVLRRSVA